MRNMKMTPTIRVRDLYIGMPVFISLFNGLRGSVLLPELSSFETIFLLLVISVPVWAVTALASYSALQIFNRLHINSIYALIIGLVVGVPFAYFHASLVVYLASGILPEISTVAAQTGVGMRGGFAEYLSGPSPILHAIVWFTINYVYEKATGCGRFFKCFIGQTTRPNVAENGQSQGLESGHGSDFFRNLSPSVGLRIIAVRAQEHYVKVYTEKGECTVHYRFRDAVQDLAAIPGLQVHRSYWVATDGISEVKKNGRKYYLTLVNGMRIPISTSYLGIAKQEGVIAN
jgi:hypothetical protein